MYVDEYADRMRAQTEEYVAAVLAAHPEFSKLAPDAGASYAPPPPDPYPVPTNLREILRHVATKHSVTVTAVRNGIQVQGRECRARWEAFYMIRLWLGWSLQKIGRHFRDRDHTTILHGIKRHCALNDLPYPRRNGGAA